MIFQSDHGTDAPSLSATRFLLKRCWIREPYTLSYILEKALFYENIGAKVPYEMYRDPSNGGSDILYSQRKVIHPFGFDYIKKEQASLSPEDTDLANPANWELVFDSEENPIDVSLIPIARIISLGC